MPGGSGGIGSPGILANRKCGKYEYSTRQYDEFLPPVGQVGPDGSARGGSDPYKGTNYTGIRVPNFAVVGGQPRYLMLLARASFNIGRRVRLCGVRQYASIGGTQLTGEGTTGYESFFEFPITSPMWRFPDGNISWHVMVMPPNSGESGAFLGGVNASNVAGMPPGYAWDLSHTPAILALTNTPDTVGYVGTNGGRPVGTPITPDLGNFHDMRFPWDSSQIWNDSVNIPITPPCDVAFFASVLQTDPTRRNNPRAPSGTGIAYLSPEDRFYLTFLSTAVYWRVSGSLIFAENCEDDDG